MVASPDDRQAEHPRIWSAVTSTPIPLLATGFYVAGFVITNAHLAQHRALAMDLLRGRYLAAGALLVFLAVVPCVAVPLLARWLVARAWAIANEVRALRRRGEPLRSVRIGTIASALAVAALLALTPSLWQFQVQKATLSLESGSGWAEVFALLAATGFAAVIVVVDELLPGRAWSARLRGARTVARFVLVPLASLALWEVGTFVYPFIPPQLGGGAGLAALVTLQEGRFPEYVQPPGRPSADSAMFAVIIDQDEHDLVFATCLSRGPQKGSDFRSVTVPRASVRRIVSLWYAVPVGFATQTEFTICSARGVSE